MPESLDDFLARTGAASSPGASAQQTGGTEDLDAFLARTGAAQSQQTTQSSVATPDTGWRGWARNAAAGITDAAGNVLNVLSDPVGNLVLRPAATLGATAYDFVAPGLGLPRMTPEQRADLLGTDYTQPGTRLVQGIGQAVGADPNAVPATEGQALLRSAVGGAATTGAFGPFGVVAPAMGAGGAVTGNILSAEAPDWLKPGAELGGNILGAYAGGKLAAGGAKLTNAATGVTSPVMDAYTRLGIDPRLVGDVSGNEFARGLQAYTSRAPGSSGVVRATEQNAVTQFGQKVEDTAGMLGTSNNAQAAGDILQNEARDWINTTFPARERAAWTPVDAVMSGDPVEPTNYRTSLSSLTRGLAALPETQKVLLPQRVQQMLDAINVDVPAGSSMTWQQAQNLRTAIGRLMGVPEIVQAVGKDQLKAAYGGISQDMQAAAAANGPAASDLFDRANAVSRDGHAFIENTLSKVIRANNPAQERITPEQAAKAVLGSGDTTLQAIRQELPHAADELGAFKLRDMAIATPGQAGATGGETSVGTFLTQLNRFRQQAPNGSAALFSDPSVAQRLSDLGTVAATMKETARRANVSGTGPFLTMAELAGAPIAGLYYYGPKGLAAAAAPLITNRALGSLATSRPVTSVFSAPGPRMLPNPLVAAVTSDLEARRRNLLAAPSP